MKKFKKLMCILLAALLLLSTGVFAVSAEEPAQPDMEALHQKFIKYLDDQNVQHTSPDGSGKEMSSIEYIKGVDGWNIIFGHPGYEMPMPSSDRIENYIFYSVNAYAPYCIGVYAERDGKIFTLKKACTTGELDIEKIINCGTAYIEIYSPGDTDMNGAVTVKDALFVQKVIAGKTEMDIYYSTFNLCDFDGNKEINVKDALDMQKKIAKNTV